MQAMPSQRQTSKCLLCMQTLSLNTRIKSNQFQTVVKITTQTTNDTSWYGLAKYAWSGSVIECPNCGEIHRSRQFWYGNKNPEDFAVR